MHEMSITRSMLEIVRREMEASGIHALRKLKVRIGELTAVEPDTLKFCFDVSIKGTPFEGAVLEIEEVPLGGKCRDCGGEFRITAFDNRCPRCGSTDIERVSGHELDIISMEGD
ncbi:MAG: hydrogenase maturation nickel metallochaperone HypA [Deltaproteobacteria bacterium RBG_19FT_COMBO_56_10]|nr:MAG: hydrogenase maturation nickel metallochaperone HypA [Deltaproteobacteria bacterium RBG_19FT_COMBO_56_10]